ncbi:DUF2975 domain-containing protein [Demequina aestuarii]|uniref:DUF2975 domain-containing protein n=1 Tax=Demequina aestuarii TaxID=327095 RepID=UPI000A00FEE8|nr:DUF2975 domain-containing protein [Demequina aestuarii]
MNSPVRGTLRLLLVLLFLGAVGGQALVPLAASVMGEDYPEVDHLVLPYSIAGIAAIACFQVAIVVVWRLLTMAATGEVFTAKALRWVEVIAWSGAIAALICGGVTSHMMVAENIGGPPAIFLWIGSLVGGTAFVLLMVVMRGLLAVAIADRSELAEVI